MDVEDLMERIQNMHASNGTAAIEEFDASPLVDPPSLPIDDTVPTFPDEDFDSIMSSSTNVADSIDASPSPSEIPSLPPSLPPSAPTSRRPSMRHRLSRTPSINEDDIELDSDASWPFPSTTSQSPPPSAPPAPPPSSASTYISDDSNVALTADEQLWAAKQGAAIMQWLATGTLALPGFNFPSATANGLALHATRRHVSVDGSISIAGSDDVPPSLPSSTPTSGLSTPALRDRGSSTVSIAASDEGDNYHHSANGFIHRRPSLPSRAPTLPPDDEDGVSVAAAGDANGAFNGTNSMNDLLKASEEERARLESMVQQLQQQIQQMQEGAAAYADGDGAQYDDADDDDDDELPPGEVDEYDDYDEDDIDAPLPLAPETCEANDADFVDGGDDASFLGDPRLSALLDAELDGQQLEAEMEARRIQLETEMRNTLQQERTKLQQKFVGKWMEEMRRCIEQAQTKSTSVDGLAEELQAQLSGLLTQTDDDDHEV